MPEVTEVKHINVGSKYRIIFERSAVKDRDGFKVEVNSDDMDFLKIESYDLYAWAMVMAKNPSEILMKEK